MAMVILEIDISENKLSFNILVIRSWTIKTVNSAMRVPTAAPMAAYCGINIVLIIKSKTAPVISEYNTHFSIPIGIITCIPITLVIPIKIRVGMIICIGRIEPEYAVPEIKKMQFGAYIIK